MGNICRSPSSEGFFRAHLSRSRLAGNVIADSAGTHSYHIGLPPDSRAIAECANFDVDIADLRARKISSEDFEVFDLIIAMDRNNLDNIRRLIPDQSTSKTVLMMDFAPEEDYQEVPDPYYGTQEDFNLMCRLLNKTMSGLLSDLEAEIQ